MQNPSILDFLNKIAFYIHYLRLGLATNSSSSHSLIFLSKTDYRNVQDEEVIGNEFGWDLFTAASPRAKLDYITLMLIQGLYSYGLKDDEVKPIVQEWLGRDFPVDGSIDHQSLMYIPSEFGGKTPNRQFFEELKDLIMSDNVVIGGGNDNDDDTHPLIKAGNQYLGMGSTTMSYGKYIARKDEMQDYWTLFNPDSGAKVRVSFYKPGTLSRYPSDSDNPQRLGEKLSVTRSATPELVDYKLTDFCSSNCDFCYMSSTINGKHAKYEDVSKTLKALADMQVFEIAYGGGEAIAHPDFLKILQRTRSLGIVPNFTTRNIAWITKPIAKKIMKEVGAFAVSVDNVRQVIKLANSLTEADISKGKVNLHIVLGTISRKEFSRILVIAARKSIRVTLLGYKDVGRGTQFTKIDYSWWLEDIMALRQLEDTSLKFKNRKSGGWKNRQYYMPTLSIDTVIAHDYEKELVNSGIPAWMFHTIDGAFSAYIDGVNNRMGPASYTNFDKLVEFNPNNKKLGKELRNIYQDFDIDERKLSDAGNIMAGERF